MRRNLTHSRSGQVLILALWTTNIACRNFDMFPEFIGGDNTEGANSEQRALYICCGNDNKNRVFLWMGGFLPSKTQWAYMFVMGNMVTLHPGTGVNRVIKFNSDTDAQETRAITSVLGSRRKNIRPIPFAVDIAGTASLTCLIIPMKIVQCLCYCMGALIAYTLLNRLNIPSSKILNRGGVDGTKLIGILLVMQNTNLFLFMKRTRVFSQELKLISLSNGSGISLNILKILMKWSFQ